MAVKIENDVITTDVKVELEQSSGNYHRSELRAAEENVRIQRWNVVAEKVNQTLLAAPATLILMFLFDCLMIMKLNVLANVYINSIGV